MNPLKKLDIRQRQPGLSAYLNYCAFVRDGVMIQKDGSFLTGFAYVGPDLDSAMPEDIIRLSNAANRAVGTLGHNYVLHVNAIRRDASGYPAKGAFPDRTTWLIDEERRKMEWLFRIIMERWTLVSCRSIRSGCQSYIEDMVLLQEILHKGLA